MNEKRLTFVMLLLLAGCATRPYPKPGNVAWSTGCASTNTTLQGAVTAPCKKLVVTSYVIAIGKGKKHDIYGGIVPADQVFGEITGGRIANWSWKLAGTPAVVQQWRAISPTSATTAPNAISVHGPRVPWSSLFSTMHAIYRYVLAGSPPPTRFRIYLFPLDQSISRSVTTLTKNTITMPLYFPYYRSLFREKSRSPLPSSARHGQKKQFTGIFLNTQIGVVGGTSCFEYMHALFLTKHLKVPNLLSHSVADWVTCMSLQALIMPGPQAKFHIPSVKKIQAALKGKWPPEHALLREDRVDNYGGMLAMENIAHLFGADTKPITISHNDHAKVLQLLKLARAMLQQPVDFTKQQLYPLDRLDSIPAYTGTSADITAKH